jgi:hypothetical protein
LSFACASPINSSLASPPPSRFGSPKSAAFSPAPLHGLFYFGFLNCLSGKSIGPDHYSFNAALTDGGESRVEVVLAAGHHSLGFDPDIVASGHCVCRRSVELPGPHPMSAAWATRAAPFRFELAVLGRRPTHHSAPSLLNAGIPRLHSTASWRSQLSLLHVIFGPDNVYLRDQNRKRADPSGYRGLPWSLDLCNALQDPRIANQLGAAPRNRAHVLQKSKSVTDLWAAGPDQQG